jgi:dynein heavy chain
MHSQVTWIENKGAMVLSGSYDTSVKMMGDMSFLSSLLNFAKEQINDETVELLQPYFAAPDFNYESARKASGNVAGLCNWAAAMCKYHTVAKVVEPKIATLRAAEAELKVWSRHTHSMNLSKLSSNDDGFWELLTELSFIHTACDHP